MCAFLITFVDNIEKNSSQALIIAHSTLKNCLPLDFLLLHQLHLNITVLSLAWQNYRLSIIVNNTPVLCEYNVQIKNSNIIGKNTKLNSVTAWRLATRRCIHINNTRFFQISPLIFILSYLYVLTILLISFKNWFIFTRTLHCDQQRRVFSFDNVLHFVPVVV